MTFWLVLSILASLPGTVQAAAVQNGALPEAAASQSDRKPNIVVILTDDQDALPDSIAAMPKMQELIAQQGMSFSDFFVPLSLCCPARATLLLGQYSHNNHILYNTPPEGGFQNFVKLGLENSTLATALDAAGYETALMGKYLNGYPDPDNPTHIPPGWDQWIVPVTDSAYASYSYKLNENGQIVSYGAEPDDHITTVLAKKAIDFISTTSANSPEVPFFLELAVYAPHSPAVPPPRYTALFADAKAPRPASFNESDMRDKPAFMQKLPLIEDKTAQAMDEFRRKQLQSLAGVDDAIADLVKTLDEAGQLDNTYIFFLSDNGLHMGQHRFTTGKGSPYDEDIRVPLMVRGPGVPAGVVRHELASLVDIAPTLAELAGTTMPTEVDGRSLAPLLHDTAAPARWRNAVLIEHWKAPSDVKADARRALEPPDAYELQLKGLALEEPDYVGLRTATYKYVDRSGPSVELYDVVHDTSEIYSQHADATAQLLGQLDDWLEALKTCAGDTCRREEDRIPPVFALRYERTDMDRNELVDQADFALVTECWSQPVVDNCGDRFDLNYDGQIDVADVVMEGEAVVAGESAGAGQTSAATGEGDSATRMAQARALLDDGKAEEALAIFQALAEETPQDREARMGVAGALAAAGKISMAMDAYTEIQSEWPDFPWAYVRRGELLEKSGKFSAAVKDYKAAIKAAPDNPDVHFFLAYTYVRANQVEDAIAEFQAGLKLDPTRDGPRQTMEQLLQNK